MNRTNAQRIKVLGILGLPLLAIAAVVMVFAWGHSANTTEAAGGGPEMALTVKSGGSCVLDKCTVGLGAAFTLSVEVVTAPANGYIQINSYVDYGDGTTLVYKTPKPTAATEIVWPDLSAATALRGQANPGEVNHGGLTALLPPQPTSNFVGNIIELAMNCSTTTTSTLVQLIPAGTQPAGPFGALFVEPDGVTQVVPKVDNVTVNCAPEPTATSTNTPTPTPTNTPTPTSAPQPRMQKCAPGTSGSLCDNLNNVWLVRQGTKIPPLNCLNQAVPKGGVLNEVLDQAITSPDPKGLTQFQELAAFEFELNFDETKICVELNEGAAWTAANAICVAEDAATKPALDGVARIGCVTAKKGANINALDALAGINIRPQPDVYSQAKPNQDNGVTVQINNVGCRLSDEQGHPIALFSCEDADLTIRYLEGDVEPDCVVDALDAQAIAFRWGAQKGSTFYREFMNLEPSGTQADNDIDINDLQFVFGRFNSTCQAPHPPQDPVNPKA